MAGDKRLPVTKQSHMKTRKYKHYEVRTSELNGGSYSQSGFSQYYKRLTLQDNGSSLFRRHPKSAISTCRMKLTHAPKHIGCFRSKLTFISGIALALSNTGNFPDRQWDVSQVGVVFVSKKDWRLSAKAREAAQSLIAEWNMYLAGDVWGYIVGDNSCWGFYGQEHCIEEAKSVADHQIKHEAILSDQTALAECMP